MNFLFKSIRWRVQLWHGVILLAVLSAFEYTSYYLARENRFRLVDQELQRQAIFLVGSLRNSIYRNASRDAVGEAISGELPPGFYTAPAKPGGGPDINQAPSGDSLDPNREAEHQAFLGGKNQSGFYYVFWKPDNMVWLRSNTGPADIPIPPVSTPPGFHLRARGDFREQIISTRPGLRVLVGRSIAGDLADLRRQARVHMTVGGVVLLLGLAGGWWVATRAIRPVKDIGDAAEKISSGNLSERINVSDTDSELGHLAKVLNTTFDQLQTAFNRQAQFTADASHELRTPVSVVLAQTQSALARERTAAEYREALEACQRSAQRMRHLIDSLLMLARLDSGEQPAQQTLCALDRVAQAAIDLLRPLAAEYGISLQAELKGALCAGDAEQLGQVVTNLVSNAIYYNRPQGEVRVTVRTEDDASVLTVSDNGRGIAPEDLPHIFERFYRADKTRSYANGRIGLGLAITKAIVEGHRGAICASSVIGVGSTFTVRLRGSIQKTGIDALFAANTDR
jgi:heavy metal sensor kinase